MFKHNYTTKSNLSLELHKFGTEFNNLFNQIHFFFRMYWEKGFTINHWAKTIILVTIMCITGAAAWVIIQLYVDPIVRIMTAGIAILIGYVCIKLLGENTVTAYQRAKVSSINIVPGDSSTEKLNTICQDVQCK